MRGEMFSLHLFTPFKSGKMGSVLPMAAEKHT